MKKSKSILLVILVSFLFIIVTPFCNAAKITAITVVDGTVACFDLSGLPISFHTNIQVGYVSKKLTKNVYEVIINGKKQQMTINQEVVQGNEQTSSEKPVLLQSNEEGKEVVVSVGSIVNENKEYVKGLIIVSDMQKVHDIQQLANTLQKSMQNQEMSQIINEIEQEQIHDTQEKTEEKKESEVKNKDENSSKTDSSTTVTTVTDEEIALQGEGAGVDVAQSEQPRFIPTEPGTIASTSSSSEISSETKDEEDEDEGDDSTPWTGPNYYVDPAAGSDTNEGSATAPFKTITAALTHITSGTLYLEDGTYSVASNGEFFPIIIPSNVNFVGINGDETLVIINANGTNSCIQLSSVSSIQLQYLSLQQGQGINVALADGSTVQGGGGILIDDSSSIAIANCIIENNNAAYGAGVLVSQSTGVTISSTTIMNNDASSAAPYSGGGIAIDSATVILDEVVLQGNEAGDAINNGNGGGISVFDSTVTITSSEIDSNTAQLGFGGGVYMGGPTSSVQITNSLINSNSAMINGGAVCVAQSDMTILNCTLVQNSVTALGGGSAVGLEAAAGSVVVKNCALDNNGQLTFSSFGPDPDVLTCAIANLDLGIYSGPVPAGWTYVMAGDLHLKADNRIKSPSPCRNAGDNTGAPATDIIGRARPNEGTVDIGAYEYYDGDDGDPPVTGTVYDSVTGQPLDAPTISIYKKDGIIPLHTTTNNPYRFEVDQERHFIAVTKSGYAYPSQVVSSSVQGDHGELFFVPQAGVKIDIPMDPDGWLKVTKIQNKERVNLGEIVTYNITIQNAHWYTSVAQVMLLDGLVNGFKYVQGSAYRDGSLISDRLIEERNPNAIAFNIGTVRANSSTTISYQVRVGVAMPVGMYDSSTWTYKTLTGERNSNISKISIEVMEDPLFNRGTILGRVRVNEFLVQEKTKDKETKQQQEERHDINLKGITMYTEYGVTVQTDEEGKYHIADVPAGRHLLKIDPSTVPAGYVLVSDNPVYVKVTEGLLVKADFEISHQEDIGSASTSTSDQRLETNDCFFVVALGEAEIRSVSNSGNISMVSNDDRYDEGIELDGRLSLYLKGKVLGKYLVTASLDTDRRPEGPGDRRRLFTNLDPDQYYPVYGDASLVDYSGTNTQEMLYILVEWDTSYAKWGSFHTGLPLYSRTFSGGVVNYVSTKQTKYNDPKTEVRLFGAYVRQKPAHDEFVGTGGSLYYLRNRDVIEGSEQLRVEVRDRITKMTIETIYLQEEVDYEIDYRSGRILLRRALNGIQSSYTRNIISNDILMGERVYLVVDYEYFSGSMSQQAEGIRVSQWVGSHVRVGGMYVEEQKTGDPYRLVMGDGTLRLNKDTRIDGMYSKSQETLTGNTVSYDGGLQFTSQGENYSSGKSGSSINVTGRTKLLKGTTNILLKYSRQDPFYSISSSIQNQGSRKYVAEVATRWIKNIILRAHHITQEYLVGVLGSVIAGSRKQHISTASAEYTPGKCDIRMEYQRSRISRETPQEIYLGVLPYRDNDLIGLRVGYQVFPWLHPYLRGQVTITGDANDQATVGVDLALWDNGSIGLSYTKGTLGDSAMVGFVIDHGDDTIFSNIEVGTNIYQGRFTRTTYGQKSIIDRTSTISWEQDYSSYQENIARGNIITYEKEIDEHMAIGLSYERSNLKNRTVQIDRNSGSIGLQYSNPFLFHGLSFNNKLDVRQDSSRSSTIRQYVTQNDILCRLTKDFSLTSRCNWSWSGNRERRNELAEFYEIGIGFSYRPDRYDWITVLGKYSYIMDYMPASQYDFPEDNEQNKNVYALEGVLDLIPRIQFVGKFAFRDMAERVGIRDWVDSDTYLYVARSNIDVFPDIPLAGFLNSGWDVAIEYRIRANRQIEDSQQGWLVEVDKEVGDHFIVGVGYNFTDYDDDLRSRDNWDSKGWFLRFSGKY